MTRPSRYGSETTTQGSKPVLVVGLGLFFLVSFLISGAALVVYATTGHSSQIGFDGEPFYIGGGILMAFGFMLLFFILYYTKYYKGNTRNTDPYIAQQQQKPYYPHHMQQYHSQQPHSHQHPPVHQIPKPSYAQQRNQLGQMQQQQYYKDQSVIRGPLTMTSLNRESETRAAVQHQRYSEPKQVSTRYSKRSSARPKSMQGAPSSAYESLID